MTRLGIVNVDYRATHDAAYRRRRKAGYPGWQDAENLRESLAILEEEMGRPFVPTEGRVLELGCGAGDVALHLASRGYDVCGIDISPEAIAWANEKAWQQAVEATFTEGNVLDLSAYGDGEFDVVVDGYCLHCIIGSDRAAMLRSAHRVLKSGGYFHVATMCGPVKPGQLSAPYDPVSRCTLSKDGVPTRYLGLAAEIVNEVEGAGFQVVEFRIKPATAVKDDMDELLLWARALH